MRKYIFQIIISCLLFSSLNAQELYYLIEGFEDSETTSRWTNDPIIPFKEWEYTYGGQWLSGGDPYNPEIPKQGNFNAGLYFPALELDTVRLISPTMELDGSGKPTLRFWHCQYEKPYKGPDYLRLLFRESASSNWDVIHEWTSDIAYWKDEVFDIEDIDTKYLTDSFQLAFEGIVGNGFGVYVDSVTVKEDTIVQKFVKKTTYTSIEYDVIPSGATDIPLERITVRILGNTGNATLDSLTVVPSGSGVNYLDDISFKLMYTVNEVYAPYIADTSTTISSATLSGGKVTFADIGYNLRLGDNNLWIVASIENTLQGQASVQFAVPAYGINISDTLYPSSQKFFPETHLIKESVFYDDFESGGAGWTLEPNFEVGWPEGIQVGSQKNPSTPFNGTGILATDLDGGYYTDIDSSTAYYAYSPELDLTYYKGVSLYMMTYFAINGPDEGVIDISTNGGVSWQNIWNSDPSSNNSYWEEFYDLSINDLAKRKKQFQLRFGITESQTVPWPGFSIDNFAIIGEKLLIDVGITDVLDPYNECLNCDNDSVKVWLRNYADGAAPSAIPVFYGIWGIDSTLVYDTLYGGIAKDDSVLFTFKNTINFPQGDYYNDFVVGIDLSGDQDASNDLFTKPLVIQKNIVPPDFENFEYHGGIWLPNEGSKWENLDMSGTIPTDPLSPKIWVLSPTGNYSNNDTSFVVSNCYNLSGEERNIIEFEYWSDTQKDKDGARFEYSIDNGNTWFMVNDTLHDTAWNWTVDSVLALESPGWSGTNEWTTVKALLPEEIESEEKVKFRILFMSDSDTSYAQGFAFDDFQIYTAPDDVGVSTIDIPKDTCQFSYPDEISLWIKNYGYNDLETNDTLIIGYDFESNPPVIDTFQLAADLVPGDSVLFQLPTTFDVTSPGIYQITAYTLIEDDPWYYGSNNDTAWKSFEIWQNPITGLEDTISSRLPDTVVIRPIVEPEYSFLWHDMTTDTIFDVEVPGTVYLTVTESTHGCETYDSVYIELLFNDVGIDSIIWPQSSCELSSSENIQVQVRNFGTDSLIIDDIIYLYYEFEGQPAVKDSLILDTPLYSGSRRWFTFISQTEDLSGIGDYDIKAYCDYGGDTIPENDTIFRTISVYGYPELDLGNDTTIIGLTYLIEVDPSFESYLWSDGDTNSTKIIDESGEYWLDILDHNGCPASDTINIYLKIRDIQSYTLINPTSSCNRTGVESVILRIRNNGTDTIQVTDDINVSYKLNSETRVNELINLSQFLPGQTYDHTFTPQVDLSAIGDYYFDLTAVTASDLRTENDTIQPLIRTNTNPVIDLGVDEEEVYYVTEMVLDAGYDPNWVYLWQDNSTNQTYTVTDITLVEVLVTDTTTGCYGGDTVLVYLDISDYMITTIGLDATSCSGEYDDVPVTILNNGNLARQGAEITLDYFKGGVPLFTEYFENIGIWQQGTSRIHTTENTITLQDTGEEVIEIVLTSDGDLRPENDDFSRNIEVIPSPDVDLGGEELVVEFPYTLDAGSGYASYLWSNGSTESTYTATQPGTYSVTVTGDNGCETIRSVYLHTGLSVSELADETMEVDIYPNPATNFITIEATFSYPGNYILEVFNGQNTLFIMREIYEAEYKEDFYIGDLPPGLYFIRIRNEIMYHVSKMVIQ